VIGRLGRFSKTDPTSAKQSTDPERIQGRRKRLLIISKHHLSPSLFFFNLNQSELPQTRLTPDKIIDFPQSFFFPLTKILGKTKYQSEIEFQSLNAYLLRIKGKHYRVPPRVRGDSFSLLNYDRRERRCQTSSGARRSRGTTERSPNGMLSSPGTNGWVSKMWDFM